MYNRLHVIPACDARFIKLCQNVVFIVVRFFIPNCNPIGPPTCAVWIAEMRLPTEIDAVLYHHHHRFIYSIHIMQ